MFTFFSNVYKALLEVDYIIIIIIIKLHLQIGFLEPEVRYCL